MLAWLVIDRTYPRQFLPKSSSLRTLCLCVGFSDSLRPASVVPTTYALPLATVAPKPLCNQSVTHSFYLDGGCIPVHTPPWRSPHDSDPLECLSHVPYLLYFQSRAHSFALPKNSTLLFSSDSALCFKKHNHRGVGEGVRQLSASSCSFLGTSARPKWATFSRRHSTPVTSHSHQSLPLEPQSVDNEDV